MSSNTIGHGPVSATPVVDTVDILTDRLLTQVHRLQCLAEAIHHHHDKIIGGRDAPPSQPPHGAGTVARSSLLHAVDFIESAVNAVAHATERAVQQ